VHDSAVARNAAAVRERSASSNLLSVPAKQPRHVRQIWSASVNLPPSRGNRKRTVDAGDKSAAASRERARKEEEKRLEEEKRRQKRNGIGYDRRNDDRRMR